MSNGGRRALVSVVAGVVGFAFVWTTIEILRTYPELRLLVIWALLLATSVASITSVVVMYMRAGGRESHRRRVSALVSAVEPDRRLYSID